MGPIFLIGTYYAMNSPGLDQNNNGHTRVLLFDMPVDVGVDHENVISKMNSGGLLISYLNPYAYSVARSRPDYAKDLQRFDLVVCDGVGIQTAVKAVHRMSTPIISLDYSGIGHDYLQLGANCGLKLCLVGGEKYIVENAAVKIKNDYPGYHEIRAFSGYGSSPDLARKYILDSRPDFVLAGLGMGRQESYLLDLVDSGWRGTGICVGGFFDKLAKPELDYPSWTEKTRLRFLGRLIREPRRMSKRYFIDYQPFIGMYLKHIFGFGRSAR